MNNTVVISTKKSTLNITKIHQYLSNSTYWARGRSLEEVKRTIEHSFCFGIYAKEENQIGFARVVTDRTIYAHLMDFIIFEKYKRQGFGTLLMKAILQHPELKTVNWTLLTADAHLFYQKFGFGQIPEPSRLMVRI